ncbi:hypothetical protein O3M35_006138 [Rhynocoris fuscipes]|uniref:Major facilitator superfamily domain-containing protein 12 n=1 Tax=Rhynocoris fuscipes TaxID=488301 RepID=A0AAW1DDN2_9HEMI
MYAGVIMLIGQIADALATPIIGVLCDKGPKIWKINLHKRKVWYLYGSLLVLLSFPFLFLDCYFCKNLSEIIRFTYYVIMVTIFQIAWAMVQIAHLAIAPDITFNEKERTTLMSIRNTFTVLSGLLIYLITYILFELGRDETEDKINPSDKIYFQIVVATSLTIGSFTSLFFYVTVKENPNRLERSPSLEETTASYKELFLNFTLYKVATVYMCTRIFCNVTQSLLPLYLNIALLLPKPTIASLPFLMFASSFLSSLISAPLNNIIGRKYTFLIGCILGVIAAIWLQFDTSTLYKQYFVYIVTIFIGLSASLLLVTALAISTDHIGKDLNNSAFLFGILSFVDKVSCGLVIMLVQGIRKYYDDLYYKNALAAVCALSTIIGFISIATIKANPIEVSALTSSQQLTQESQPNARKQQRTGNQS